MIINFIGLFMIDYKELYSYFSHNFRTNVATIIATVEAAKLDLIDIGSDEINSIYESAYLLDLYDASLSICIDYMTGKKIDNNFTKIKPKIYIENFLNELSLFISENSYEINTDLNNLEIETNEFVFKNFLQLILSEIFRLSPEGCNVIMDNTIKLIPKYEFTDIPIVFELFAEIFDECNIKFIFSKKQIGFEFI
jgi:hypothetical protein